MIARLRRLVPLFAALALCLLGAAPAGAAPLGTTQTTISRPPADAAAQELAEKYVPIAMLREQLDPPCEKSAEQYQPTAVGAVLGNPSIAFEAEDPGTGKLERLKQGATAADLAGVGDGHYLNLPGTALGDTCVYARDFERLQEEGKAPAVVYAHIAREPNHPGFALQYWFFWYFNQFNDLHEGDWEGMQLTFAAETAAEALGEEPGEVIVFQHAGGERAEWGEGKVRKEGTHPIVYPAAGSHATFYDSAVYIQNGQHGSGVGCDNTTEPLREVRPHPVLLPEAAPAAGRFQWLGYRGRWGEREKGFNNGPTGPVTKTVWREPFAWMAEQRTTSPRLPGGSIVGPTITGAFCGAVAGASDLINLDAQSRPLAIATIAAVVLAIGLFVGLTKWGPIDLTRLRARRSFGQIVRSARQLYGRHWLPLTGIGLAAFPIVGGANLLAGLLGSGSALDDAAGRGGFNLALGDLLESFARPAAMAVVAGAVVVFVRLLATAEPAGFGAAWRGLGQRFWRVVGGQMLVVLCVFLLGISVIGLPFAAYFYVAWSFVKQQILFHDRSVREAMRASSELVRGRWWRTLRVVAFLFMVSVVTGPVISFALIFTALPLLWINLLGALIFALLIPYVALGETLLFLDLEQRAAEEPARPRRSWRPWRPRQFGRRVSEPAPQPAPSG